VGELRLIVDPPLSGAWNMAADEVLLDEAADDGPATLRFYRWSEPTLSLGYFQTFADRDQHAASRNCVVVRRQSGGGAILHDRELTYSVTLPGNHPLTLEAGELYRGVHEAIIAVLQPLLTARDGAILSICEQVHTDRGKEPFLCFQRRATGDVLLASRKREDGVKIVGSAQRRRRGAVLQHGSILLEASPAAPELPGLRDRTNLTLSAGNLAESLAWPIASLLGMSLAKADSEIVRSSRAEELVTTKYGSPTWTKRR
jgi:lipoate-protein ligase A